VKQSLVQGLIRTGELRGFQVGARGLWRIGRQDVEDYIDQAYQRTAERIAAGEIEEGTETGDQEELVRHIVGPDAQDRALRFAWCGAEDSEPIVKLSVRAP